MSFVRNIKLTTFFKANEFMYQQRSHLTAKMSQRLPLAAKMSQHTSRCKYFSTLMSQRSCLNAHSNNFSMLMFHNKDASHLSHQSRNAHVSQQRSVSVLSQCKSLAAKIKVSMLMSLSKDQSLMTCLTAKT